MTNKPVKPVTLVSATRAQILETRYGRSTIRGQDAHQKASFMAIENNAEGLSTVYNRVLNDPIHAHSILVFVHDDLSIQDSSFFSKIRAAHETYNIVGLAGGDGAHLPDKNVPPLWHVLSRNKSGIVAHTTEADGAITSVCFGPTPRPVQIIDGLFMSLDVENCKGITFDEDFDFHLYDLALCARANRLGLSIGTWPIWVIHDGLGNTFRTESWRNNALKYNQKYRS